MAQGDCGYALPRDFTKDTVLQIFGYNTADELEQFLRKCPRHYLRNYFAEVYLGSADRVHEIRSNNDKYLLNKLVQAIRAAGIPVDVGSRRQAKAKVEKPELKPAQESPQKPQIRPVGRQAQPASYSMTARAGPQLLQPPASAPAMPMPAQMAGQWPQEGAAAGASMRQAQQLAQMQALMQQQLLQYYQALLPALAQQAQMLGPQAQLQQLAALQAQLPSLLLDGSLPLPLLASLPGLTAFSQQPKPPRCPKPCVTELPPLRPRAGPSVSNTPEASISGTTGSERDAGSGSEPESPRRRPGHKRGAAGHKRKAGSAGASRLSGLRKAARSRSSSRSSPEPAAGSDDSAAAFRALLNAVEVAQNEEE